MAWNPPQQGQSPQPPYNQYPPPQGHSPYPPQQQPYGAPPPQMNQQYGGPGGYPPQGPPQGSAGGYYGSPGPQQGVPAPPQGQYQQQQYQQYPPQQGGYPGPQPGGYGGPPQGGYPGPQQGGYGAPAQGGYPGAQQGGYPPQQQQYGAPQYGAQQYGAQGQYPPQGQQGYGGPPPGQYGAPPPQQGQYGPPAAQPTPPSIGYDPHAKAQTDGKQQADALRKAMKGFGTDEDALIRILKSPDPVTMAAIKRAYSTYQKRDLIADIKSETSSWFEEGLCALVRGPLGQDVWNLHDAIHGIGTKEVVLNDVLLNRSNADMRAIKQEYQRTYHKSLESAVGGDLSMKTKQMFDIVLGANRAEESAPIIPQDLERDIMELNRATERTGTDEMAVCSILCNRSDGQIRAISIEFKKRFAKTLEHLVTSEFSGHMKDALLHIVHYAEDRTMADAKALMACMEGAGTKDRLLVNRLVRIHWAGRAQMQQVRNAFRARYKADLTHRIRTETSGHYEHLLLSLVEE